MSIVLPDPRLEMPELLIPNRQPKGRVVIGREHALANGLVDALLPMGNRYTSADDQSIYGSTNPAAYDADVDAYGRSIRAPSATTATYQLSAANTASKFTRPYDGVTVMVVLKRLGDELGNSPIFAWGSATKSPYVAWGITDFTGLNILRLEMATGSGYHYIEQSGGFTGDVQCIIATYDGYTATLYSNGVRLIHSNFPGALVYPAAVDAGPSIGNYFNYTGAARSFNGNIYMCALWDRGLSVSEVAAVSYNSYQFLIPA